MLNSEKRESPLVRFRLHATRPAASAEAENVVWERAFCTHINLRGDPHSVTFLAAVEGVLGAGLPTTPNTVVVNGGRKVYWLGPNEWLIVAPDGYAASLSGSLKHALNGQFFAVTDVSGGQTVLVLQGNKVRELLARGCSIDLHPRVFAAGACAQSHLAKAPVLLSQIDSLPTFELIIRRSFADYLWLWLNESAFDFKLTVVGAPEMPTAVQRTAELSVM